MEFIGGFIEVLDASNPSLIGLKGMVVDETKNLFVIKTEKGLKKIQKHLSKFKIAFGEKKFLFSGDAVLMPPEERIKIKTKQKQWQQKNKV